MFNFTPLFSIGDKVWYNLGDSDQGIVLDITYSIRNDDIRYLVSFGREYNDEVLCYEQELSANKIFLI